MKSRLPLWAYIATIAIAVFFLLGCWALIRDIIIQYQGHKAGAVVTAVPLNCKRKIANTIKVMVENQERVFDISLSECRAGKYQVGQQIEVLVHPDYKRVLRANDRADYTLVLYIVFVAGFFFVLRYAWKWLQKIRGGGRSTDNPYLQ
ncbi:MAG TPA: hypothetical protein VGE90_10655 [Chitinophaga sp.]